MARDTTPLEWQDQPGSVAAAEAVPIGRRTVAAWPRHPPQDAPSVPAPAPPPPSPPKASPYDQDKLLSYFIAGGAAGAASRTVVSPLERLKIIMQVQPHSASHGARGKGSYSGVWQGLTKMVQQEGVPGLFRGNGINCLRIAPYSAVQFATYEVLKTHLAAPDPRHPGQTHLTPSARFTAGALAGITSVVSTYPLDLVRARISIATADLMVRQSHAAAAAAGPPAGALAATHPPSPPPPKIPGIWPMTVKVYREEGGLRGLYRGCIPVSLGVAPYVAGNFFIYEYLRSWIVRARDAVLARPASSSAPGWAGATVQAWAGLAPDEGVTGLEKLIAGAVAGSISQTLTYPLDVLRRRMQVAGMPNGKAKLGYSDKSSYDVFATIIRNDGVRGLYRGLWPNLLKVAPSIGVSFGVYEWVQAMVKPPPSQSAAS